ncbi:MAG: hypothetical protein IJL17_17515 [Kiritimatiellae bacterium]|nr:hypothetical protein [Kiritimatiellia bacterium]
MNDHSEIMEELWQVKQELSSGFKLFHDYFEDLLRRQAERYPELANKTRPISERKGRCKMACTTFGTRSLISMCAFATLANCAKADIEYAQEHQGTGRVVVHDPEATIGRGNELFKWTIVSPDGTKGFGNDFMTNALSVVTEDGTNYYAHVQGANNDRTKVIHFTVNKDGIPNKHADVIDTTITAPNETNTVENMKNSTLAGIAEGYLYFHSTVPYPMQTNPWSVLLRYNLSADAQEKIEYGGLLGDLSQDPLIFQNNSTLCFLSQGFYYGYEYDITKWGSTNLVRYSSWGERKWDYSATAMTCTGPKRSNVYVGDTNGNVLWYYGQIAQLPGAISGLSNNGDEVFATSEATNAFYNVTLGNYNVVKDENGQPKPMIPPTKEGLLRVIDNRKRGGKFLYVTRKGIHSIE